MKPTEQTAKPSPQIPPEARARLTPEVVAALLGCKIHDIPILVAAGLLVPLDEDDPVPNTVKYFARAKIAELSNDVVWLGEMTAALRAHWRKKNKAKKCNKVDRPHAEAA